MAIIDLIKLSQNQRVVADVMIPIDILNDTAEYNQVVLLYTPVKMNREHYFDREDKKMIIDHIMTMPNPEKTLENVLNALTYRGEEEIETYKLDATGLNLAEWIDGIKMEPCYTTI